MRANPTMTAERKRLRRDLLRQYMQAQRRLIDADPSTSTHEAAVRSFRQLGYMLISSGFEEDLDRLLRIRVLDGGLPAGSPGGPVGGEPVPEIHVLERRLTPPGDHTVGSRHKL